MAPTESSTKRAPPENATSAGDGGEQRKRARKSRWERDDSAPLASLSSSVASKSNNTQGSPAGALSEIVKRLTNVVNQKAAPAAATVPPSFHGTLAVS
ncbi:hypothetical protein PINS_up013643 [Pythium insidiosum]|nr:hypothetical protein PINS_up013643 [Pythium insidiosum]